MTYAIGPGAPTPAVKILLITNIALFLMNVIVGDVMTIRLGLSPQSVFEDFALWQPVTYMFLHSTRGLGHILFNMLALWMFGTELERTWGTRFFTKYYFVTGVGAAATNLLLSLFIADIYHSTTVGASGAIYGLLAAAASLYPDRKLLLLPLPGELEARTLALLLGGISVLHGVTGTQAGTAHFAHLGGMAGGWLLIQYWRGRLPLKPRRLLVP